MSSAFWITATSPTDSSLMDGLTILLKYGSSPLFGRTPGATAGTFTEDPASSGCYSVTVPESNIYTVTVNGVPQNELTDVPLIGGDVAVLGSDAAGKLGSTSGAGLIGILDSAGRITGTTVEAALAELAGASRTTETIKSAYDLAATHSAILASITSAMLVKLTSVDGVVNASDQHTHSDLYYTEAEVDALLSTGITGWRGLASGANCSDLTLDLTGFSGNGNGGDFFVDLSGEGNGYEGSMQIKREGTYYPVVTQFDTGGFDFSGSNFLSNVDPADYAPLQKIIQILDSKLWQIYNLQYPGSGNWKAVYRVGTSQTTGAVTADVVAEDWHQTSGTPHIIHRVMLHTTNEGMWNLRIKVQGKSSLAGAKEYVRFTRVADGAYVDVLLTVDSATWATSAILALTTSPANPEEFTVSIIGDGTNTVTLYKNFIIEAC
jgi:hypothetical protein